MLAALIVDWSFIPLKRLEFSIRGGGAYKHFEGVFMRLLFEGFMVLAVCYFIVFIIICVWGGR